MYKHKNEKETVTRRQCSKLSNGGDCVFFYCDPVDLIVKTFGCCGLCSERGGWIPVRLWFRGFLFWHAHYNVWFFALVLIIFLLSFWCHFFTYILFQRSRYHWLSIIRNRESFKHFRERKVMFSTRKSKSGFNNKVFRRRKLFVRAQKFGLPIGCFLYVVVTDFGGFFVCPREAGRYQTAALLMLVNKQTNKRGRTHRHNTHTCCFCTGSRSTTEYTDEMMRKGFVAILYLYNAWL